MNKKLLLFCLTFLSAILLTAQDSQSLKNLCGTVAPPQQWDAWFNSKVEEFQKNMAANKGQMVERTIPIIVHVVYWGEPEGTFPNIDSNQIKSQIPILNADFAGTGLNVGNVPSVFSNLVANTGVKFCLASKDRQDQPLVPYGIERVSAVANSWLDPTTAGLDLKSYFTSVIMPATIWDPTRYLNIWVSDKPTGYALNGFATYPPASGLSGIFGGDIGTATCDGIWVWARAFGTVGSLTAPQDQGRTATHEIGHWLGLRHIWGDGNCLSDYCGDTPTAKQAHYGCVTSTPADQCGVNSSPLGEMPMNFMDRSDDACMYMFTHGQNVRMQTALSQSPLRNQLGSHNKCAPLSAPDASAVAMFTVGTTQCLNIPFTPFNTSSGFPYPTYAWSASPTVSFSPNNMVPNPAITLSNPGSYTLTLVSTNSVSSSSYSMVVSAHNTCTPAPFCHDSINAMMTNKDTLTFYRAPVSQISGCTGTATTGYLTGTNCYKDREIAQFFSPNSYSLIPKPQINSMIVLFDSTGTKAFNPATQVVCKIYGGSVGFGPTSVQGTKSDSLGKIIQTPLASSVGYLAAPNVVTVTKTKFYPFRFDFPSPIVISSPNSGFYAGIQIPTSYQDSISVLSTTKYNSAIDSSAWYLSANLSWRTFRTNRNAKVQLAMLPVITCGPVGINDEGEGFHFRSNINVMPNPSNGLFNFVFTLPKEQTLYMNIYNSMGQVISSSELKHIMNDVISIDLSDRPDGVYFTEITNGSEKTVRKIVVSH
jgi:hypothetical protein